jgi:hypothetical protein
LKELADGPMAFGDIMPAPYHQLGIGFQVIFSYGRMVGIQAVLTIASIGRLPGKKSNTAMTMLDQMCDRLVDTYVVVYSNLRAVFASGNK